MKTDKLINNLKTRLDAIDPESSIIDSNQDIEGINTWKGKRIISVIEWKQIVAEISIDKISVLLDLNKGFKFFPNSYIHLIFEYKENGPTEKFKEVDNQKFDQWFKDYVELLEYKKDFYYGNMQCRKCILNPLMDKSGLLIGIHKIIRKIISEKYNQIDTKNSLIPLLSDTNFKNDNMECKVVDKFQCPYQGKLLSHDFNSDTDFLFYLYEINMIVEYALLRAIEQTKNHESIFEVDFDKGILYQKQFQYNGSLATTMKWDKNIEEILKEKISNLSIIQIKNKQDIIDVLLDNDKLNLILRHNLRIIEYLNYKNKIFELFNENIRQIVLEKLNHYSHPIHINTQIDYQKCSQCGNFANIYYYGKNTWLCQKHCLP